jgi:hypothetical protein
VDRALLRALGFAGLLVLTCVASARAETSSSGAGEVWFDPKQLPTFTGTIDRFLIDAGGRTDGVLLKEGPQIILAVELGERLRTALHEGDRVTVYGIRARNAPVITALAVQLPGAASSIVLHPGLDQLRAAPPVRPGATTLSASGKIKTVLRGIDGSPNGAVLEDGTIVHVPSGMASGSLLEEGKAVTVQGVGHAGPEGRSIAARVLEPARLP